MMVILRLYPSATPSLEIMVRLTIMVTAHPVASNIGKAVSLTILLALPFPPTGLTSTSTLFRYPTSTH